MNMSNLGFRTHPRFCPRSMLVLTILFSLTFHVVSAKLLGSFVLPHGGISLNPSRFDSPSKLAREWAWKIHRAAVEVGRHIRSLEPDIIFLSTPHGVSDLTKFTFYVNPLANGTAETDNCKCPPCCYDMSVKIDVDLALNLATNLSTRGHNVSGLSFFGPPGSGYEPVVLKWAEVIPLIFVKEVGKSKVVVLSQPSRRYTKSVEMIPELLDLGRTLYQELDSLKESVVIIISSDLAHTHDASGPYGYSSAAEPYDKACGHWASTLHPSYLLDTAAQYVDKAESCGFTGLVMLHGALDAGKLSSWVPVLHANYHPSYYGMMVASFVRGDHCPNCVK